MGNIKYTNPPLKEVSFEIRFPKNPLWDPTVPGLIYGMLKEDFPNREKSNEVQTEFIQGPDGVHQNFTILDTLVLKNPENTISVQISQSRLGLIHTTPYSSWDNLLFSIDKVLNAYLTVVTPSDIERIGLRYINECPVQRYEEVSRNIELKNYFNIYPHLGTDINEDYDAFVLGMQIPFNDRKDILRLQLTNGENGIIFDLDYFSNNKEHLKFETLGLWLQNAHDKIISKFEGGITDKLRAHFGEIKEL